MSCFRQLSVQERGRCWALITRRGNGVPRTIVQEPRSLCRRPSLQSQGLEGSVVEECGSAARL